MKINWGNLFVSLVLVLISILGAHIGIGRLESNFFYLQVGILGIICIIYLIMTLYVIDGIKKIDNNNILINKLKNSKEDNKELNKLTNKQRRLVDDVDRAKEAINTKAFWGLLGTFLITFAIAWGCVWVLKVNFYVAYLILAFGHIADFDKKSLKKSNSENLEEDFFDE